MTTPYVLTVDAGLKDLRAADHLLLELAAELALPEGAFGCTHLLRGDRPRVALSLTTSVEGCRERLIAEGYEVKGGAPDAVGRAVLYPGAAHLTGTLTVGELLSRSAIDAVTVLGAAGTPDPATPLVTRDHVRPQWLQGRLVLTAMPAAGGRLTPFEVPDPTPCCADH
ncbi:MULTISPECIES: hypothetical protein [unclassified Streptomyces]|uniref:hypothetical protein n=1 Tax=unclassified Streptomyces TaxID=2593676 RepID=UPI00093F7645|nr:hypothetical protein [Streptomyces sp. TSRI0107]OKJ89245.1 hypothetical protein AMK31_04645 [Streptomyces sp. TSRI0107]